MLRFAAEDFWKACELLTLLAGMPDILLHSNGRTNSVSTMNTLLEHLHKLNLKVSLKEAEKMLPMFNAYPPDGDRIKHAVHHLSSVIHSELDGELFFHMEASRANYWHPLWLVGTPIHKVFRGAHEEIQAAGRCFACGEPTACVFHLMRTIDAGLRSVADSLEVSYDARNWHGIADKIQKHMEQKYSDKTDAWKQSEPFYASVLTDIQAISRGHRNPALHDIERKYTDADAHYLLTTTEAFMRHLVENGMKEKI